MNTDQMYWFMAGIADRRSGNDKPAVTREDFHREIEDERIAKKCAEAYRAGFEGRPLS